MNFKWIDKIISHASSLLFLSASMLAFIQVIFRYVFNSSLSWSEELLRYLFIWMFFLASALCVRDKMHVSLDILTDSLKPKIKKIVLTIIDILMILFLSLLVFFGTKFSIINFSQLSTALHLPMGVVNASIPIGSALMILYFIRQILLRYKVKDGNA